MPQTTSAVLCLRIQKLGLPLTGIYISMRWVMKRLTQSSKIKKENMSPLCKCSSFGSGSGKLPSQNRGGIFNNSATAVTTTTVQHSQTTTTTGNGSNGDNVNLNMGINVGDQGGNISINASEWEWMALNLNPAPPPLLPLLILSQLPVRAAMFHPENTVVVAEPATVVYEWLQWSCWLSNANVFRWFQQHERNHSFQKISKTQNFTIAKQVLQNNCLTASQVREVLGSFDFENTKLEYAKYAYAHTYDIGNYYKVNDAFEFESSVDDLNKYISK